MHAHESALAEQRLNRLADTALYHQGTWLLALAALLVLKPHYYREAGQCLGMAALLASFIASRIYIQAGKNVEKFKRFSEEERRERMQEYLLRFFCPYFVWGGCIAAFSWV